MVIVPQDDIQQAHAVVQQKDDRRKRNDDQGTLDLEGPRISDLQNSTELWPETC